MYSLREKVLMASKWLASFSRSEWTLDEYPARTRPNGDGARPGEEWLAQMLNWPGPAGVGASKEEAIAKLGEALESAREYRRKNGEKMPRPGRKVPISFAATGRVLADPTLHDDFIVRVLGFGPSDPVFISDQSSLGDFGDEAHVATLQKKIVAAYGVDVSDLKEGLLSDILERIQKRANSESSAAP
ncbi:MAG: hypothetical protein HY302_16750 [Opitutae bacterium]|nr:hypothetical protein [Opitutae bacterium]